MQTVQIYLSGPVEHNPSVPNLLEMTTWVSSFTLWILFSSTNTTVGISLTPSLSSSKQKISSSWRTNSWFSSSINKSDNRTSISSSKLNLNLVTLNQVSLRVRLPFCLFWKYVMEKNCKYLQNVIQRFNWLKLNITTLIEATTQLGQNQIF